MFESVSRYASARFAEVQGFDGSIRSREPSQLLQPLVDEAAILRGFFFVYLYAAFEASIRLCFTTLIEGFNSKGFLQSHLRPQLHAVTCAPQFVSLSGQQSGPQGSQRSQWAKRRTLLSHMRSNEQATIHEGVFGQELQNPRCRVLKDIFDVLAITASITPDPRYENYIEEVVEKRNQVAHGRETPVIIGRSATAQDRAIRIKALQETVYYIIDTCANHLSDNICVDRKHRKKY